MLKVRGLTVVTLVAVCLTGESRAAPLEKKLINFGWDMHSPAQLAERIGELQHLPFDGLTVRVSGDDESRKTNFCYPFFNRDVDLDAAESHVEAMSRIEWGRFTDNFLYLTTADNVDWFDEKAWNDKDGFILQNVRAMARLGRAGGCRGILFDPEHIYWGQPAGPWKLHEQARRDEKSVAEFRAMVRKRGAQFINAIEQHMPDVTFLTLFWVIQYAPVEQMARESDPARIDALVADEKQEYGLLHDFMLGVLEGADRGTTIVDGNERAYYARHYQDFNRYYHAVKQGALGAVPEALRYKYRAQVQMGQAIYTDVHSNTRPQHSFATYMTPDERALSLEQVVYNALKNSDRYVWFYTELPSYLNNKRVEAPMIPAIERARRKVAANEPLGFDFEPIEKKASKAYKKAEWSAVEPSTAEIARAVTPPQIDGNLDDEAWSSASRLGPFQCFRTAVQPLETTTTAWMAWDQEHLYIAFRNEDPKKGKLDGSAIEKEEEQRGYGHLVQVGIATDDKASSYHHIRLTFRNTRWDAVTPASIWPNEISGKNSSWDGKYRSATSVAPDRSFWIAELAIPWADIGRAAPEPGDRIKGNLVASTDRREHGQPEQSSWSLMVRARLIEAKTLGTWVFK